MMIKLSQRKVRLAATLYALANTAFLDDGFGDDDVQDAVLRLAIGRSRDRLERMGYNWADLVSLEACIAAAAAQAGARKPRSDGRRMQQAPAGRAVEGLTTQLPGFGGSLAHSPTADLLKAARTVVLEHGRASDSLVQRYLRISYRATAQLLDELEKEGTVSARDLNGARTVLKGAPPPAQAGLATERPA